MQINGKTKICGLLGKPVKHTLSPTLHNGLAKELGHNLIYTAFEVEKEQLEDSVKGAKALDFLGLNVTVPYKNEVIPFLKEIDPIAQQIGAVNTLVSIEGGFKGYNTDIDGLLRDFQQKKIILQGAKVIILGAGGAARAATFLCGQEGVASIYLLNRTIEKAFLIAEDVNEAFPQCSITVYSYEEYEKIPGDNYLVIQATSIGLSPNTDEAIMTEASFYKKVHTGYDIIYNPARTKFMEMIEEEGGLAYNGLGMLLYQGIKAYELWNKTTVNEEVAQRIYRHMRKELGQNE